MIQKDGLLLLASVADKEHGVEEFLRLDVSGDWFFSEEEKTAYEYVYQHVSLYGAIPSRDTILIETEVELPAPQEPAQYYLNRMKQRYLKREVKKALVEAQEQYKQGAIEESMTHLLDRMSDLSIDQNRKYLVDYAQKAREMVMAEYAAKWKLGDDYGIQLGYPTLDEMNGGLLPGDVFVIAGRPAAGKTYLVMNAAQHVWEHQKKVPLVLSMEMPIIQISQRMAAIQSKVPITGLRKAELSTPMVGRLKKKLDKVQAEQRPFWLVEGNLAASVKDLRTYVRQLKPDVVFVDGAYLMHTGRYHRDNWQRVKDVVEELKQQVAQHTGIPVVASYQMNRDAAKKHADVGTEMLAYSDAIGQIASVIVGLVDEEDIESLVTKTVKILKGRSGEKGSFKINWRFDTGPNFMDFSEVVDEPLGTMQFI